MGWLASTAARTVTIREAKRTVNVSASARHASLRRTVERTQTRTSNLLMALEQTCGSSRPCRVAALQELLATEGASWAALDSPGSFLTVGTDPVLESGPPASTRRRRRNIVAWFDNDRLGNIYYVVKSGLGQASLTLTLRASEHVDPIFLNRSGLGRDGESLLTNHRGAALTPTRRAAPRTRLLTIDTVPLTSCLAGRSGAALADDYRGVPMITGYRHVSEIGGGCVLVHLGQAETFEPLRPLRAKIYGASVLFGLLGMLVAFFVASRLAVPISRLEATARRIRDGDFDAPVPVGGPPELRSFATMFGEMAEAVRESQERLAGVAGELQRSLLPEHVPPLPGVEIAVRYIAGAADTDVGGDWYDVIALRDGRTAIVIGDVVGRGVRAASIMGQLRIALRAFASEGHPPERVLERANALVFGSPDAHMATVLFAALDAERGLIEVASAGHLPPLLRDPSGRTTRVAVPPSIPLGVVPTPSYQRVVVTLPPAAVLVLYTDGLVESRTSDVESGISRLAAVVAEAPHDAEGICEAVLKRMEERDQSDDVAMLVLRLITTLDGALHLTLPAEPASASAVRRALANYLEEARVPQPHVSDLLVATSEACANVIQHAYASKAVAGEIEVEAMARGDRVVVRVIDTGTWRAVPREHDGRGVALMRALTDSVRIRRSSAGTTVRLERRTVDERNGNGKPRS